MKLIKSSLSMFLIFFLLFNYNYAGALDLDKGKNIRIVFIGNSITYGVGLKDPQTEAPPAITCTYLQKKRSINEVKFSNQGENGATSVDFLPSTAKYFNKVVAAAKQLMDKENCQLIFSIKLGTNDSAMEGAKGAPVSPSSYKSNLETIINELLKIYPNAKIVLQYPIWYSPNTYNRFKYLQDGLDRLESYFPQIDALVSDYNAANPGHVFVGDKKAFKYFKRNYLKLLRPEKGQQGYYYLHPNDKGAEVLGGFWAKAIYKSINRD